MHSVYDNVAAVGALPAIPLQNVAAVLGVPSICQAVSGSSEVDGLSVDTLGLVTIMALIQLGAATGTPTSYSFVFKVQSSADGSTSWFDVTSETVTLTSTSGPLGTGVQVYPIRVSDSMPLSAQAGDSHINRYLRGVVTPTFVDGSSPAVPVAFTFIGSRFNFDPVNP